MSNKQLDFTKDFGWINALHLFRSEDGKSWVFTSVVFKGSANKEQTKLVNEFALKIGHKLEMLEKKLLKLNK